jgi:FkbM family methyltransferase
VAKKRSGFSAAKLIGGGLAAGARLMTRPLGGYYGARTAAHASSSLAPVIAIRTKHGVVRYRCPSATVAKHAWKLLEREPDTIAWIDEYVKSGDHLWDVGANIGAFSVYACLRDGVSATAFEPVAGNFDVLTQAVILNGLGARVTPLAMGLSDETGLLTLYLIDTEAGAGLHALDAPVNVRGSFEAQAAVTVPVMRGDDTIALFGAKQPVHVKIDVDGHEMRVLKGMTSALANARTVWIEMTGDAQASGENARIGDYLGALGFQEQKLTSGLTGENRLFVNRKT